MRTRNRSGDPRLDRLRNSTGAAPAKAEDLDWALFRSFPDGEISRNEFLELVPAYLAAIEGGVAFDFELLYVPLLEMPADRGSLDAVARSAADRVVRNGFDAADTLSAVRFGARVLTPVDPFLDALRHDPSLEKLRLDLTVDFVLDARELDEYLVLSYLRDDDPFLGNRMRHFPVQPQARRALSTFFDTEGCRRRLGEGWDRWTDPSERAFLEEIVGERLPRRSEA